MTGAPKNSENAPISVAFLVFDGFQPIDLSGPWQAFATANDELGHVRYALSTCGLADTASTTDGGLRILVDHTLDASSATAFHTVVVPGGEGVHAASRASAFTRWLRHQDTRSQRTCSVCSGAFLLAAAGVLDGQSVTTHWRTADRLRRDYPQLDVADERIFHESGKYWTAAGVTAGIDLALGLIERDCGEMIAQRVARRLVVYLRRSGDQRQYSQTLRLQDRAGAPFRTLIDKMEADLARDWHVDDMSDECAMSRRTFQRKFTAQFGVAPSEVLRGLRADRAQMLLAGGTLSRKEIARQVGMAPGDF